MPPSRIIIILCVVVFIAFGISLALSARTGRDQRAVPRALWIEALQNAFIKNQKVPIQDISSSCLKEDPMASLVLESGQKCEAVIKKSRKAVRKLRLRAEPDSHCTIDFVPAAGDNGLPVHSTTGSVELTILRNGGTLTISCDNAEGKNCVVRLE